jgi:hypothetical protein
LFVWKPVIDGVCTLEELDRYWTMCDLRDYHEALDLKYEYEKFYMDNHKPKQPES